MRRMPLVLLTAAAILWGIGIGTDADGESRRVWIPLVAGGCAMTIAGLHQLTVFRATRASEAMTRAVLTRPLTRFDTGPLPAVQPVPPPRLAAVDGHGGQHRKRPGPPWSPQSAPASSRAAGQGPG